MNEQDRSDDPTGGAGGNGGPAGVQAALQEALDRGEQGDWQGMAERLRDALEEDPDSPYLLCWLGVAEWELGMEGIAYERFRKALAGQPEDPVLLATAGNALAHFDDPEAESALRAAAMLGRDVPMARWMYGAYLAREGFVEDALRELDAALELDPEDATILLERGVALALADRPEDARAAWSRSVEADPSDGWAGVLLGLVELELEDLEAAAAALEEAARHRPEDSEAQLLAALALGSAGWDDRALEMLERARLRAEGEDRSRVEEAAVGLEEGPEAAGRLLRSELAPMAFRERLMTRP